MFLPFNRVKLIVDSSSETVAAVCDKLRAGGIPYDRRTRQNRGALGKAVTAGRGVSGYMGGMPAASFSDALGYVYTVYVRRADEARARELCHL